MVRKKLFITGLAFSLLFGLTGCDLNKGLLNYKTTAKVEIETYAEERQDNYAQDDWITICDIVEEGKTAVDEAKNKPEVDTAVNDTTDAIDNVPIKDFVMKISTEKKATQKGENFEVFVELKNNSGHDHEIAFSFLVWPHINGWNYLNELGIEIEWPQIHEGLLFKNNTVLRFNGLWSSGNALDGWQLGNSLDIGIHELSFVASFYLNWQQTSEQHMAITSNKMILTVQ